MNMNLERKQNDLNIRKKEEITVMIFYSNNNPASVQTMAMIKEFSSKDWDNFIIRVEEINYDEEKHMRKKFGVNGIPIMIFSLNGKLTERYHGEKTEEEFETIIHDLLMEHGDDNEDII